MSRRAFRFNSFSSYTIFLRKWPLRLMWHGTARPPMGDVATLRLLLYTLSRTRANGGADLTPPQDCMHSKQIGHAIRSLDVPYLYRDFGIVIINAIDTEVIMRAGLFVVLLRLYVSLSLPRTCQRSSSLRSSLDSSRPPSETGAPYSFSSFHG